MKGSGALAISDDNHLTTTAPPLPANISTGPPLNYTRNRIHCGGSTGLNYDSCFDAFQTLDHRDVHLPVRVGQRGTGFFAYNLPWRRISGDGRCAFDIIIRGAAKFEVTTSWELNSAALDLMNKCVRDEGQKGGIISGIGKTKSISIILRGYDASAVSCQDGYPQYYGPDQCDIVLANMAADVRPTKWGPRGSAGIDQITPKFLSRDRT
ncbi:MAG: hypothetical protein Q9223_003792 [Gallowayella weberi]